ncbi:MAG: hypothetical protein WED07_15690 [Candidatus Freyarchaeum deiterrae]
MSSAKEKTSEKGKPSAKEKTSEKGKPSGKEKPSSKGRLSGKLLSWAWIIGIALSFVALTIQQLFFPGAILSTSLGHIHHYMYSLPIVVVLVILKLWKYDNFWVNLLLGFFIGLVASEFYWILVYGFPSGFLQIFYWILITGSDYTEWFLILLAAGLL